MWMPTELQNMSTFPYLLNSLIQFTRYVLIHPTVGNPEILVWNWRSILVPFSVSLPAIKLLHFIIMIAEGRVLSTVKLPIGVHIAWLSAKDGIPPVFLTHQSVTHIPGDSRWWARHLGPWIYLWYPNRILGFWLWTGSSLAVLCFAGVNQQMGTFSFSCLLLCL